MPRLLQDDNQYYLLVGGGVAIFDGGPLGDM